jgi:hypothetical protein
MQQSPSWETYCRLFGQEILPLFGTPNSFIVFIVANQRTPFWVIRIQSTTKHPTSKKTILILSYYLYMSRDSSVGIATDYELDGWYSIPGKRKIFFSSPRRPDRLWGPPSLLSNGYQGSITGVKWPGREADHSPASSVEVKNGRARHPLFHTSSWRGA